MSHSKRNFFIILGLLTILLFWVIYRDLGILRILIGLPYMLFLPGYLLLGALSIKKDLSRAQVIALSFGMSIIQLGLLGLGLNFTPWGLKPLPVYIGLSALVFLLAAIAPSENFSVYSTGGISNDVQNVAGVWKRTDALTKAALIVSLICIIGTVSLVTWRFNTIKTGERFTEFYALGSNNQVDSASLEVAAGQQNTVVLGVTNKEQEVQTYNIQVVNGGDIIFNSEPFRVQPDEQYESQASFYLDENVTDRDITFHLYKAGKNEPYRSLILREGELIVTP